MSARIPTLTMADGRPIPQIGFGLFKVDPAEAQRITEDALEVGYRHLDTATAYGNEAAVGAAIAASGIARDELFVTTKVWNDAHGRTATRAAFERSCERLGIETIDLYLIHWPVPTRDLYRETWQELLAIAADGGARSVGVSNFLVEHLDAIARDGGARPAVNQIEVHPTNQDRSLVEACADRDILVEAYSPLARGAALDHPGLGRIAAAHERTISQVILRWHLQHDRVVLPKTTRRERMRENLDVLDFALDAQQVAAIDDLDEGARIGADPRTFTGD
ncbi:aldo/keto reductase [Agrococcus versicolor]|uniref:Aldo/keto reductase n=1 Tax=Agrococcus versicolor TaxID=501482 RepID=A0ABP5MP57_9MICO